MTAAPALLEIGEAPEVLQPGDDGYDPNLSQPVLTKFKPFGYQATVLGFLLRHNYGAYTPEILLSGSVGSAKSVLLAHITVLHCLQNPGACVAIGRRSLGDLKKTLYKEIIEHISMTQCLIEGVHYKKKDNTAEIHFANGSSIIGISWGDKRYSKFRSLKLSGLVIEELTENEDEFMAGFKILKGRVRRIAWVKVNFVIAATNPGEPDSVWYKYFIEGAEKFMSRMVFYSLTKANPYLDPVYLMQLMQDYSVLEAARYLEGKWISLEGGGIYHAYSEANNFRKDEDYEFDWTQPLYITFDFNTAEGKPQSAAAYQIDNIRRFHFFRESVIEDANWCIDNLDDFESQGLFSQEIEVNGRRETFHVQSVIINGDATGRARSSNSLRSNYDLIKDWFGERSIPCQIKVPKINPPLVKRWTIVNSACQNARKEIKIIVYQGCPTLNTGMKLAKKKADSKVEDDSKSYQHITTALGYGVCSNTKTADRKSRVINL